MSGELLLNATCVTIRGRGLLLEGPPGSGKSSLALALIDRGAVLVGDDGALLRAGGERLFASPPPRLAGKLEVRNLGLIDFPTAGEVPLALAIRLDPAAERWIAHAESEVRLGLALPLVRLAPGEPTLALRAELALARFGLPPLPFAAG